MVMFYHYTGWKYPEKLSVKLSHFIFNGSDAVSFFFVLSGFVLSFPFLHGNRRLDIGKFYVNRIFRIYPAFIIALILNALFSIRNDLKNAPLDALWNTFGFRGKSFWEELLLIRGRSAYLGLDWTLTIEIVMSFFIPFLIAMTLFNKRLLTWFVFASLLMGFVMGVFVLPFALGMIAAVYYDEIRSGSFKTTKWYKYRALILSIAFLLFSIRHIDRIFPLGEWVVNKLNLLQLDFFTCTAIASFIFLVAIIHFKSVQHILEKKLLLFLGKISYGIYLLHWVIVAAIFEYWPQITPHFPNVEIAFMVMMVVCVALTVLLSTALYYWIELPFIRYGKQLIKHWKETLIIERKSG